MIRSIISVFLCVIACWPHGAQSAPARLGIILLRPAAADIGDLLTAELSQNAEVQLLERAEIDKVYREQTFSAQNTDLIKLGQILGTDGLLELDAVQDQNETKMSARLIAAKPGVVLLAQSFTWPNATGTGNDRVPLTDWARFFASQLAPLFPKLAILSKDAVPVSIVNLRSAVQSAAGTEEEREIKLLSIERLSREPRLFVLERQRLESLSEEKELKSDNSPFWNGSYLLDGVLDAKGYSASVITLSARLTPPKGGTPVLIELSGSRTNLPELADQLARKVVSALQINSVPMEWKTSDEAAQYLAEAKWSLKWNLYTEAETAAESAWALGKRDIDSATARIHSYMLPIEYAKEHFHTVFNNGLANMTPSRGLARKNPPTVQTAERAQRALELYLQFSRTLDPDEVKMDSPWVKLGIDALVSASRHLQHFWLALPRSEELGEKFASVRSSARSTANWLANLPAERKTYFVTNQAPAYNEQYDDFEGHSNIFRCEVQWGSFWQERPEDALALYRNLIGGSRFPCIHQDLWFRPAIAPRMVSWTPGGAAIDKARWRAFVGELDSSTNSALVLEGKAMAYADALASGTVFDLERGWENTDGLRSPAIQKRIIDAGEAFFGFILTNYDSIVTANEQLVHLDWGLEQFNYINEEPSPLLQEYKTNYAPRLKKLHEEHANSESFQKQKAFLAGLSPYEFRTFCDVFENRAYTKAQAAELLPLVTAYESNLINKASGGQQSEKFFAKSNAQWVDVYLAKAVRDVLNPSTPSPPLQAARAVPVANPGSITSSAPLKPKPASVLFVNNFHAVPRIYPETNAIQVIPFDHSWNEGRLLWGLQYQWWSEGRQVSIAAVAIFDPRRDVWDIVKYPYHPVVTNSPDALGDIGMFAMPASPSMFGSGAPFALFNGDLYLSENGGFEKFDGHSRRWSTLNLPDSRNARLFVVNKRLFAANRETISEITDAGQSLALLASVRRRPAQSLLDSMDTFNRPALFPGPNHSLRVTWDATGGGSIFALDGSDWHRESAAPGILDLNGDVMLFISPPNMIWFLGEDQPAPVLAVIGRPAKQASPMNPRNHPAPVTGPPLWDCSMEDSLNRAPATAFQSNLFFLTDSPQQTVERNYDARLVYLRRGVQEPIVVPLKFLKSASSTNSSAGSPKPRRIGAWLQADADQLFICRADRIGIWSIPLKDLPTSPPPSP